MAGPDLSGLLNPDLLVWAREQSRMGVDTAAQKIGQSTERLTEWESGERVPTLSQLRTLANVYKRSIGVFFLNERPRVPHRPVDYRQLEVSAIEFMTPALANGIREAEAKREAALDILAQLEDEPPAWNLSIARNMQPEAAAAVLVERLGITMATRARWTDHYEALNGWRSAIESLGVMVVQLSRVPIKEMRGCSLAIFPLPVIILNSADSPLGRIFTLLHELTHLARAESSLCDIVEDVQREPLREEVEIYCNRVAGNALVPRAELLALNEIQQASRTTTWGNDQLRVISRRFWASREATLRRLLDIGKTSKEHYQEMRSRFVAEYEARREEGSGQVPQYRLVLLSNGRYLTRLAVNAYASSAITGSELSRILNTKLDHLPKIKNALRGEVIA
ncbi:XRE family transcriptional regulator [Burkholderia pseudomallei]|uniref:XRE family transcriptional regulator n=1 Tax=Burkholderia pseudomallei TaxID=28450 RepID=UPI0009B51FC9|nr:XRE family transcriptional regulator [Burkholderia pseudomallei]